MPPHWRASLALTFRRDGEHSVLAERRHEGPLSVQKALYPEGCSVCHVILLHAPGGIAGGDSLAVDIRLEPSARALLTTPAAAKWYKANGSEARQVNRISVADGAILEYLPQETILFDEAQARMETVVDLSASAVFTGWEVTCFGRRASGESFSQGSLRQSTRISREGRPIWNERLAFGGGDRLMRSPIGLGGHHVSGTMVAAGFAPRPELIETCRAVVARAGTCGVTALPGIVAARYLGDSAEHAKRYFESLRAILRPWYAQRPSQRPRIWDT